ncbi:MAG: hypothetical protein R3F40_05180 [Candidatus Competibacteraceae bacterium]
MQAYRRRAADLCRTAERGGNPPAAGRNAGDAGPRTIAGAVAETGGSHPAPERHDRNHPGLHRPDDAGRFHRDRASAQRAAPVLVNTRALRQSVRNVIRTRGDWDDSYDEDGYGAVDDIVELAEQAQAALEAGDGRAALAILEAVTDEFSKHWEMLDEIGEDVSVFLDGTQTLWSEALLDPDLSAEERRHWADRLGDWMEDFDETAADGLELLQIVVRQGWDDPTLTRILRGETVPVGLWGDDPPPHDQRAPIAQARLRILERTGQHEAYLNLAQAEHQYDDHALKLLQLDRVGDAVRAGLEQPLSDEGLLKLVKALYERDEIEAAFQIAEHGLRRKTRQRQAIRRWRKSWNKCGNSVYTTRLLAELAAWLRDQAATHGQNERALAASLIAFRIAPSLDAYQRVETLAGGLAGATAETAGFSAWQCPHRHRNQG